MARKRIVPGPIWPAWFYSPINEDCGIFSVQESVPEGWTRKRGEAEPEIEVHHTEILDKSVLTDQLVALGVDINPTWGNAHMKRIIDGDVSPTW